MRGVYWCAAACALAGATLGPVAAGAQRSAVPFVYVIDYSDRWIKDPAAANSFGNLPPDVLHIGKAVPVTHNWGPIPCLAGENQHTGGPGHTLDRNAVRLLSPAELEQKVEAITAAVARLHAAGVPRVMPYICHYSIAGDHETRQGLWQLYDRWEEYAKWLGPRPPEDPSEWVTKDAAGKRVETGYGFTPPYFAPLHRYAVCPNNPSWNQFSADVVRLIARCGYDGVFVDNSFLGGDGCKHCRAAFAKWVGESFDAAALKLACGTDDLGEMAPDNGKLSPIVRRWHIAVVRDRLAMLRREGAAIRPGFQIFPNTGDYQKVIPFGDGCDLFMFENTAPPGCLVDGEPPERPDALVRVAEGVAAAYGALAYDGTRSERFSEVTAEVRFPRVCPPGRPAELSVNVLTAGASNLDADCLEALALRFTHLESGKSEEVRVGPEPGVGDPRLVPGAKRPPIMMKGAWTPAAPGSYAVDVIYRYTDAEHIDVANHLPIADRLGLASFYRVSLPGLALSFNSRCKTVALAEKIGGKGWENVQELALAEGAASGGRHAVQSDGAPQQKYGAFFRKHGQVGAGLAPYAPVTLLYSYWGGNPGEVGRGNSRSAQEYLSARHVLFRGLVDRDLEAGDLQPARGRTLLLVCRGYDLAEAQVEALRRFVSGGGRLLVENSETRINFRPLAEVLGVAKAEAWRWDAPPDLGPALCDSLGRLQGVRFAAFANPAPAPRRLVLHALNYNVSLMDPGIGTVTTVGPLDITLAAPAGWKGAHAKVYDPDATAPAAAACTAKEGVLRVSLPPLRIYQMVELTAQ